MASLREKSRRLAWDCWMDVLQRRQLRRRLLQRSVLRLSRACVERAWNLWAALASTTSRLTHLYLRATRRRRVSVLSRVIWVWRKQSLSGRTKQRRSRSLQFALDWRRRSILAESFATWRVSVAADLAEMWKGRAARHHCERRWSWKCCQALQTWYRHTMSQRATYAQ